MANAFAGIKKQIIESLSQAPMCVNSVYSKTFVYIKLYGRRYKIENIFYR